MDDLEPKVPELIVVPIEVEEEIMVVKVADKAPIKMESGGEEVAQVEDKGEETTTTAQVLESLRAL